MRMVKIIFWTFAGFTLIALSIAFVAHLTDHSQESDALAQAAIFITFIAGIVLGLLSLIVAVQHRLTIRSRRSAIILMYLDQAVQLNLPFSQFLASAEASEPRLIANRLRQLRSALEDGASIATALDMYVPEMSLRNVALIRAGEGMGSLSVTLRRLAEENRRKLSRDSVGRSFFSAYPVWMSIAIVCLTTMIMVFVMPKFQMIFKDFGVTLPATTIALIAISRIFTQDYGWIPAFLILSLWFVWPYVGLFLPRWSFPLSGWFHRDRDLTDMCRVVADSLSVGLPLTDALRTAASLRLGWSLNRRLLNWAEGLEQGQTAPQAARNADMPSLVTGLTATAEITAAAESFRFLSSYYSNRFNRFLILLRSATIPIMVFIFGSIVGFIALALFQPMIALISAVSNLNQPL